jgi:hypothetical protein
MPDAATLLECGDSSPLFGSGKIAALFERESRFPRVPEPGRVRRKWPRA